MNLQNGYGVKLETVVNCGEDEPVVKIDTNSSLSLSEYCIISLNACGDIMGFKTMKVL